MGASTDNNYLFNGKAHVRPSMECLDAGRRVSKHALWLNLPGGRSNQGLAVMLTAVLKVILHPKTIGRAYWARAFEGKARRRAWKKKCRRFDAPPGRKIPADI
nr:hypothetical protein [bacterium]